MLFCKRLKIRLTRAGTLKLIKIIKYLELRVSSVRIKGYHALKWSTCSYSNTEQWYSIVTRQIVCVGFKLIVHGGTGVGGLVVVSPRPHQLKLSWVNLLQSIGSSHLAEFTGCETAHQVPCGQLCKTQVHVKTACAIPRGMPCNYSIKSLSLVPACVVYVVERRVWRSDAVNVPQRILTAEQKEALRQ